MTTAIEWTDETWNPTTGCDRTSPGCDNCYAATLAKRLKAMGSERYQNDGDPRTSGPGFKLTMHENALEKPLFWRKPRKVFVNSMSDLFHPDVETGFIQKVWDIMAMCPQHTFQVLTKRPRRAQELIGQGADGPLWTTRGGTPLPNVWLGTSIENDNYTFRADWLRRTKVAVRFLSLEPLLGPLPSLDLTGIDWVIVGGESGGNHRPVHPDWVRDIRDRCQDEMCPECGATAPWSADDFEMRSPCQFCAGSGPETKNPAFLFKQWGGRTPKANGRELDGRTWDEYPT